MKKTIKILSILLLMSNMLLALSPEIKFDMLKTKLAKELKSHEYKESLKTMQKIKEMGIKLPNSFSYFEAKALFESDEKAKSYKKFEFYIDKKGKGSKYYKESISYMIKAEKEYKKEEAKKKAKEAKRKAKREAREAKRKAKREAREKRNQIDKAYGWITPSDNICRDYGGKTKSSSYIIKCRANWENAKSICRASGGHLPSLIDLRKVINDCNWNNSFKSCPNRDSLGYSSYWSAQDRLEDNDYFNKIWSTKVNEGYEELNSPDTENIVRCVKGVDVPLQRVKKIIPKRKKRSRDIVYYNLKLLSIEDYEDDTIGVEVGYKSGNSGLGAEFALTYTISSLEEENPYNTSSFNLTYTIPLLSKSIGRDIDVVVKGGYMVRKDDEDFIYGGGIILNFKPLALSLEYQTSDNIAFSDITSLGLIFMF